MKLMIAVLNQGWISCELTKSLLHLQNPSGHRVQFLFSDHRPIDYNRNFIVDEFLKTDCDGLIMMDSDMVPRENILEIAREDYQVISAVVFIGSQGIPYPLIMKSDPSGGYRPMTDPDDKLIPITEVDGIGTGCVFIRRDVLEKLPKPHFRFNYGISGEITLGEDYSFSQLCKRNGIKLWVDTGIIVGHLKELDLSDINRLFHKAFSFNKQNIAKVLNERFDPNSAKKMVDKL
jgi:hypothetical protein